MRIIRSADHRRMPWKNGLGETAEVAIAPPEAALEAFDWRISIARVAAAGPFSSFPGVDRTLTVLAGAGIRLTVEGGPTVELTTRSAPFAFAGDVAVGAELLRGPITDLNVMTRRERYRHRVRMLADAETVGVEPPWTMGALFCAGGRIAVDSAAGPIVLASEDLLFAGDAPLAWRSLEPARALWILIGPR
ncbi:MAG: HutD family protein [Proteobacteria bacterium]|nr:HutD family protein [Pseudomonadota bacterium]